MPIPTNIPTLPLWQTLYELTSSKYLKNTYEVSAINMKNKLHINKNKISLWLERWFLSSNAKDIGVLYLIFALLSGLIGTAFSVLIRLELSGPGVQFIADNQLYNSIITAHAIVMIFFMVVYENMSNIKSEPFSANTDNDFDLKIDNDDNRHNNNHHEDNKNFKHKCVKVFIKNPYNNRDAILKITKRQKGVYLRWASLVLILCLQYLIPKHAGLKIYK